MYHVYHIQHPSDKLDLSLGYIGVTKKNPKRRFWEHSNGKKTIISKAIKSHALTDESLSILFTFESKEEAYAKELELRPLEKMGWNQAPGGLGGDRGPDSDETRLKKSLAHRGENNHFYGKTHTLETRKKIRENLLSKDSVWRTKNASNAGKANIGKPKKNKEAYKLVANSRPKFTCEYCNKTGQYNSMIAHHGTNCKMYIKTKT